MNIFIAGDDMRMEALRQEAVRRGHALTNATACDIAALGLPASDNASRALDGVCGKGRAVLLGTLSNARALALEGLGWRLLPVHEDEGYTQENARVTAEGAVYCLMARMDRALRGAQCVVVGFGRIGRELTRILVALGARVTVAARRAESRVAAVEMGARAFAVEGLIEAMRRADAVINTVPTPLIGREHLLALPYGAHVLELASPPYGVALDLARAMGLNVALESGLPARYAPRTCAGLLMERLEACG